MKVMAGWSKDYSSTKFDVVFEDQDITRLLEEKGIPRDRHAEVTTAERFQVAWTEVERLSALTYALKNGTGAETADGYARQQAEAVAALRSRLGLAEPAQ